MNVYKKRAIFTRRNQSNVYRMFFWIVLSLGGIWLIRAVHRGEVKPLFLPTSTPTRLAQSYALEGDAKFIAGQLNDVEDANGNITSTGAITAYREAAKVDPTNAKIMADLARIQVYSSAMLVGDAEIKQRLTDALDSAKKATELDPDSSYAHAVYAFALDWNANSTLVPDELELQDLLSSAEREAARALLLDNTNTLALAFYAEILTDQQKWAQGLSYIEQALQRDSSLMDVHRVHAYVLETQADYAGAIEAYDKAIAITPNLSFLYLRAGANYRRLAFGSPNEEVQKQLFEKSLEYFAASARINEQLNIPDPQPYLSIARTYSQMGQFFIAIRNVQKTIEFQPSKAEFYGELGVLYHKNRNYETGILAFKCAIRGCTPEESCDGRGGCGDADVPMQVTGLPLTASTIYYYDIYASELAALDTPKTPHCDEALAIAKIIADSDFDEDPNIAADIVVVRNLCTNDPNAPTATPQPAPTNEPVNTLEPTLTVTP
ncbi:MAG: tetratricopeptide repeat protein [Anaerolineales bacterium]|nr:tetratricopeptide repeat protein [Anaerolineales bacterium]MCZ2121136.1 tetratricopeptide repeat protein [Anaerolineales bacterium]